MNICHNIMNAVTSFFGVGLWQTFAGVMMGIPAALWIQHRLQSHARTDLKRLLQETLTQNEELLNQLETEINSNQVGTGYFPLYPLNLMLLDATAHRKYEQGLDSNLCQIIDKARYELHHLDGKLSLIRESWSRGHLQQANLILSSCKLHLPQVRKIVGDAKTMITSTSS